MDIERQQSSPRPFRRRRFLALSAGAAGAAAFAVNGMRADRVPPAPVDEASAAPLAAGVQAVGLDGTPAAAPPSTPEPTPTSTPPPAGPPVSPRGYEDLRLMAGTEWEAAGSIHHSGQEGPRVLVLGGVHGNEPGGWLGAEEVANWEVRAGSLIVLPRINWRSANAFERTLQGFGDLNRLYPGHPDGLPMARMAAEIVALVEHWRPAWVWDMHESWGFFNERGENGGTAFIGQTVTTADASSRPVIEGLVGRVNAQITARERFETRFRAGGRFGRPDGDGNRFPSPTSEAERTLPDGTRGSSSLSLGRFVPGVRPVLVEMGQMDQPEARRAHLHQLLLRELLADLAMV